MAKRKSKIKQTSIASRLRYLERNCTIQIRVPRETKALLQKEADKLRVHLSPYLRGCIGAGRIRRGLPKALDQEWLYPKQFADVMKRKSDFGF